MGTVFRRNGAWWVNLTVAGKRIRKRVGPNKEEARRVLAHMERRALTQRLDLPQNDISLSELGDSFFVALRHRVGSRTYARALVAMAHLGRTLHLGSAMALRGQDVDQYREQRLGEGIARGTVNIEVGLLKRLYQHGVDSGLIAYSPISKVRPLPYEKKHHRRALTSDEIQRLLAASEEAMRPVWLCFVTTGLRKSELINLTWRHVDLKREELRVGHSKTAAGHRVIPLQKDLLFELQRLQWGAGSDDRVFLTGKGTPHQWNLLRKLRATARKAKIDIEGLDLHALRYTFITELLRQGVPPHVVQQLAGHRSVEVTMEIYAQVHQSDKRDAVRRLNYGEDADRVDSVAAAGPSGRDAATGSRVGGTYGRVDG